MRFKQASLSTWLADQDDKMKICFQKIVFNLYYYSENIILMTFDKNHTIQFRKTAIQQEDQWSCKRSPEICCIYE